MRDWNVRAALELELGTPVRDQEWATLQRRGFVEEAIIEARSVGSLVALVREMRLAARDLSSSPALSEPPMVPRDAPLDEADMEHARLQALGRVVRMEAERNHRVRLFRLEYLEGSLVSWEDILRWVGANERCPTLWIELPIDLQVVYSPQMRSEDYMPQSLRTWLGRDEKEQLIHSLAEETSKMAPENLWEYQSRLHWLAYYTPYGPEVYRVATSRGGALEELREVSALLVEIYPWSEAQAATFVLTGYEPVLTPAHAKMRTYSHPSLAKLDLEVDPAMSPRALGNYFAEARQVVVGQRHRDLSLKSLHLAIFMQEIRGLTRIGPTTTRDDAAQGPKVTWEERMHHWNSQYPEWRYDDARKFTTDCTRAHRRLLGEGDL